MKWSLFRTAMIPSAVESCRRKRLCMVAGSEKRTFGETKMLKKLSEQRKMRLRPCCKTGHQVFPIPVFRGAKSCSLGNKNVKRTLLGRIWSSVGFQLFIGKQSILADHSPIAWEKFMHHNLHQGFNWEHSPWEEGNPFTLVRILWRFIELSKGNTH